MTNPLDRDGDGKPGGSLPDPERKAIIAKLTELNIPFYKGATTETLKAKLPMTKPVSEQVTDTVEEAAVKPRRRQRVAEPEVVVEVTKIGDGRICTGEWDPEEQQSEHYLKGETFKVAQSIADDLEDRGLVVIR